MPTIPDLGMGDTVADTIAYFQMWLGVAQPLVTLLVGLGVALWLLESVASMAMGKKHVWDKDEDNVR